MSDRYDLADPTAREAGLAAAVTAVRRGKLVVLPTDTVYGLGVDAFDAEGVQRLLDAKGRGRDMPPPVLISSDTTLEALATELPGWASGLVEKFWPGPLTIVCRQQPSLRWDLGETRGTVAIRMPDDQGALDLLGRTGPLAVSSANNTGHPAATTADEAEDMLGWAVEVILDGGPSTGSAASTIVDCTGTSPRILREGVLSAAEIDAVLEGLGTRLEPQLEPETGAEQGPSRRRTLEPTVREYLLVFLMAGVVSYLLCVFARELAIRSGAVARVRDRDVHATPIPYFGGVAMLGGLGAGLLVAHHLPFLSTSGPFVFHDSGIVLIGGAMICAVGVVDDLIELDALTKLGGQILAAGFLVLNDVRLWSVKLPGANQFVLDPSQGALLTMLLVVGTMNAVNFVDGLDGLAGGVVLIGAVAFFLFSYQIADANGYTLAITAAMLCAAMGGACAGFLPHNFFPARIFMGDSGSMLLGLVLSGSALTLTGQFADVSVEQGGGTEGSIVMLLPILLPVSILVVPLADLVLAVVRRTRRGQAFYQPDKEHLHHRLLEIGHSQRRAVLIMWLWAGLIAFGAVLISLYSGPVTWVALATGLVTTVLLTFLLPRVQRPGEPRVEDHLVR